MNNIFTILLALTTLAASHASGPGSTPCFANFQKVGCFKRNEKLLSRLLITDLDPTHDKWGADIDWSNYQASLKSMACRCWEKAHREFKYFAIGFYGECWTGKDDAAIDEKITNPGEHASTSCVNGEHKTCDGKSTEECAGTADNEYIYEIIPEQKPPILQQHHIHIQRAPPPQLPPTTPKPTTPKPTKPPKPADCIEKNVNYQGYSFKRYHRIPSATICAFYCLRVFRCKVWTWIPHRHTCLLKRSTYRKSKSLSYVSGKRNCGISSCKEDNIDYFGHDYTMVCHMEAWWRCSFECMFKRRCRAWTWSPKSKCCHFKTSAKGRKVQRGLISGRNVCTK